MRPTGGRTSEPIRRAKPRAPATNRVPREGRTSRACLSDLPSFVIDVRQDAAGGFKLVVPVAEAGVDASRRDVNTLTLSWDKVVSNALR